MARVPQGAVAATAFRRWLRGLLARYLPYPRPPSYEGHWDGTGVLTEQECARFHRDGFLVFDPQVPEAVLDGVIEDLHGRFQGAKRLLDAWHLSEGGASPRHAAARAGRPLAAVRPPAAAVPDAELPRRHRPARPL